MRLLWWTLAVMSVSLFSILLSENRTLDPLQNLSLTIAAPMENGLRDVADPVSDFFRGIFNRGDLVRENERLREELERLQTETAATEDAQRRLQELEEALGVKENRPDDVFVVADVIAQDPSGFKRALAIDRDDDSMLADATPRAAYESADDDDAILLYTGGTTGVSKGAMLTHGNLYINTMQARLWFTEMKDGKERMMGVLPFFHVFAMTVVMNYSISVGAEIIIHPRFDLVPVLKDINNKKPTLMPGVPTMFQAINTYPKLADYDLTSIKACISGGAPLPLEVRQRFEGLTGCRVIEGYGLTETSPVVCANPLDGENKENSIGIPMPRTVIEITDRDDPHKVLAQGEVGEICISGPQVMKGYWRRDDATAETIMDGRLHTGDLGYMDEDGYTFIIDRIKDMILVSGFNVYPRNVEEAIYLHPAVDEVTVIGVTDDYSGQAVKAFVKLKADANLESAELTEFLRERLGKHEMPKHIEFRGELPKTMIGKLSKKELVAEENEKYEAARATSG